MNDSTKAIAGTCAAACCSGVGTIATTGTITTAIVSPVIGIVTSAGSVVASAPALPFLLAGIALVATAYVAVEAIKTLKD